MFHVVLVAPEIAGNTGAIIRLCANIGAQLHLIEPLGFHFESAALKRAGLDYHDLIDTTIWPDLDACRTHLGNADRWFATSGRGETPYHDCNFIANDVFVFGSESVGLASEVLETFPARRRVRIPMRPNNRSLNLANAAAVVVYEAWRQCSFAGATSPASDNNAS